VSTGCAKLHSSLLQLRDQLRAEAMGKGHRGLQVEEQNLEAKESAGWRPGEWAVLSPPRGIKAGDPQGSKSCDPCSLRGLGCTRRRVNIKEG